MLAYSYIKHLTIMRMNVSLLFADSHKPSIEQEKEKLTQKSIIWYLFHAYKSQK